MWLEQTWIGKALALLINPRHPLGGSGVNDSCRSFSAAACHRDLLRAMKHYRITRVPSLPPLSGDWDSLTWADVPALHIAVFHHKSSEHRPRTQAKLIYDEDQIGLIFRVEDRYVRCVHTDRNSLVCVDSCVEFFVEPVAGRGYFNFEINCGGTILLHYNAQSATVHHDPVEVNDARLDKVRIYHSMERVVDPEITDPVNWIVEFRVPYEVFEAYVGPVDRKPNTFWRANFHKCGDHTSHPHWAMWNEIPGELGFHKPEFFAPIRFA